VISIIACCHNESFAHLLLRLSDHNTTSGFASDGKIDTAKKI